jgi:hypothetical protein
VEIARERREPRSETAGHERIRPRARPSHGRLPYAAIAT